MCDQHGQLTATAGHLIRRRGRAYRTDGPYLFDDNLTVDLKCWLVQGRPCRWSWQMHLHQLESTFLVESRRCTTTCDSDKRCAGTAHGLAPMPVGQTWVVNITSFIVLSPDARRREPLLIAKKQRTGRDDGTETEQQGHSSRRWEEEWD